MSWGLTFPQTVQDVYDVAKAFVDNDMSGTGNTIGLSGPQSGGALYATFLASSNNVYGFDPIFSAMGSYPGYWIEKDGAVTYGSIEPETKEALEFLQKMYKGGLIDPEMSVRANSEETVVSGQSGMFFGPWWMGYSRFRMPSATIRKPIGRPMRCRLTRKENGLPTFPQRLDSLPLFAKATSIRRPL